MTTYRLTEAGRAMTWREWKKNGGCGLSGWAAHYAVKKLGPIAHWDQALTLGDIASASVIADREISRFGMDHLGLNGFAAVEQRMPNGLFQGEQS